MGSISNGRANMVSYLSSILLALFTLTHHVVLMRISFTVTFWRMKPWSSRSTATSNIRGCVLDCCQCFVSSPVTIPIQLCIVCPFELFWLFDTSVDQITGKWNCGLQIMFLNLKTCKIQDFELSITTTKQIFSSVELLNPRPKKKKNSWILMHGWIVIMFFLVIGYIIGKWQQVCKSRENNKSSPNRSKALKFKCLYMLLGSEFGLWSNVSLSWIS